ncbi:MAG TPA: sulfatase-like hydrolase/transferase, partial [Candidatus Binatus sp.]|nr:sulfatase-like hydrolase/transferase [Candidatus Binatus sp.]
MPMIRALVVFTGMTTLAASPVAAQSRQPNVILIITDDQGHGDLGVHGNPKIRTPNIDAFSKQCAALDNFYVCPVCSPTRSGLITGRYTYRTGIVDTAYGRSMMHPDEVTLAEMLAAAGYGTGIFGKWHLGDNYPLRPMDQGFQESLVLKGGGIGQPSDPPGGDSYFDPLLLHNGKWEKQQGYCSDVYTNAAMKFIEQNRAKPFFVYLPFNCPHSPLQIADSYVQPYKQMNMTAADFPKTGFPLGRVDFDVTAKIYGMVTNIDDNLGRLFKKLDELNL